MNVKHIGLATFAAALLLSATAFAADPHHGGGAPHGGGVQRPMPAEAVRLMAAEAGSRMAAAERLTAVVAASRIAAAAFRTAAVWRLSATRPRATASSAAPAKATAALLRSATAAKFIATRRRSIPRSALAAWKRRAARRRPSHTVTTRTVAATAAWSMPVRRWLPADVHTMHAASVRVRATGTIGPATSIAGAISATRRRRRASTTVPMTVHPVGITVAGHTATLCPAHFGHATIG